MKEQQFIIDVDTDQFSDRVIDESSKVAVVVDFWAPWCGPCRTLGPILEKMAKAADGQWILAKVNIDDNQELATRFGVRGIPAVKAFVDGEVVDEFTGVLPQSQIERWLDGIVPSEADALVDEGRNAEDKGDLDGAERAYRDAIAEDANHPQALLGLARISVRRGAMDTAQTWLDEVPPGDKGRDSAEYQKLWFSTHAALLDDIDKLRRRVDTEGGDLDARWELGVAFAADGHYEEALEQWLEVVIRDRDFRDDVGRKTMLRVFKLLDDEEERRQWQRRLGQAMY